ncbi:MAG: hypothetical protein FJW38_23215 [Acidobacteria bacterium]|nr:hypothetical protein [Acidobacteriota bacterium]
MPKWLWVVVVIIAFFVIAGFVERRRVLAMEAWRRAHGFTEIDPFVPDEHPAIQRVAERVTDAHHIAMGVRDYRGVERLESHARGDLLLAYRGTDQ